MRFDKKYLLAFGKGVFFHHIENEKALSQILVCNRAFRLNFTYRKLSYSFFQFLSKIRVHKKFT